MKIKKEDLNKWLKLEEEKSRKIKEWELKWSKFKEELNKLNEEQVKLLGKQSHDEVKFIDVVNLFVGLK